MRLNQSTLSTWANYAIPWEPGAARDGARQVDNFCIGTKVEREITRCITGVTLRNWHNDDLLVRPSITDAVRTLE